MKILSLGPVVFPMPPVLYGGAERGVFWLLTELIRAGHEITVIGAVGTLLPGAKIYTVCANEAKLPSFWAKENFELGGFDFIMDHTATHILSPLIIGDGYRGPLLLFFHGTHGPGNVGLSVPLSQDQLLKWDQKSDGFRGSEVCYPGISKKAHPFNPTPYDFVLFLGKINEIKGALEFVDFCERVQVKGVLAGPPHNPWGTNYVDRVLEVAKQSEWVDWIGEVGGDTKLDLLQKAACLVFPTKVREACPMAPIEAMMCGTPVLTWDIGPMREVVGVAGGCVAPHLSVQSLCQFWPNIQRFNRTLVRAWAVNKFDSELAMRRILNVVADQ